MGGTVRGRQSSVAYLPVVSMCAVFVCVVEATSQPRSVPVLEVAAPELQSMLDHGVNPHQYGRD